MSVKKRFSKDSRVKLVSIEEFLNSNDYLCGIDNWEKHLWKECEKPYPYLYYYRLTPTLLISSRYNRCWDKDAGFFRTKLQIEVAYRDGETEYEVFDRLINEVKSHRKRRSKKTDARIEELEKAKKLLPGFKKAIQPLRKPYESYLIDTGYKTTADELKDKYLVFDVETNGLGWSKDDLLSLSIFDPTTGMCYNRFLPLDLQPTVLTGYLNGITDKMLENETHLTQEEFDWLSEYFHFKDRTLLSFSADKKLKDGKKTTFDALVVQNYCKRHSILGFDDLQVENIKERIPKAPYGYENELSKDNLCKMFGIEGVTEIHSSYNDCLLEWKLFEKVYSKRLLFLKERLYDYSPEYIVPCTYLNTKLAEYANIEVPDVQAKATELLSLRFPQKLLKSIRKFPTNITGMALEHGINAYLGAIEQDNMLFLSRNKSHLKYVGSLDSRFREIKVIPERDGTFEAVNDEDKEYVNQVNDVTSIIMDQIKPIADYLKTNIFTGNKIMTQELVFSDDRRVLALCDLSDSKNVVEIKTKPIFMIQSNDYLRKEIAEQLYYQAKGRNTYVLSIDFYSHKSDRLGCTIYNDLFIRLYKAELTKGEPQ